MEVGECKSVHIMQCNAQSSSNAWGKKQAGQQGGNEGQETRVKFGEELIAARWCFLVRALLRPLFARNFLLKVCSQLQCQFYGRHIIVDLPCFLSAWQPRLRREEVARKRTVGRGRQLYFGCAGFHQHCLGFMKYNYIYTIWLTLINITWIYKYKQKYGLTLGRDNFHEHNVHSLSCLLWWLSM